VSNILIRAFVLNVVLSPIAQLHPWSAHTVVFVRFSHGPTVPFDEYWIVTFAIGPAYVQLIAYVCDAFHFSDPSFGELTVMLPKTVNGFSDIL
jgi:hypothetical protein